jgi:hypothetical protein
MQISVTSQILVGFWWVFESCDLIMRSIGIPKEGANDTDVE